MDGSAGHYGCQSFAVKVLLVLAFGIFLLPLPAQAQQNTVAALSVGRFSDSLGVNTHMMNRWAGNAYTNVGRVAWQLRYVGIRHARDCFCDAYSVTTLKKMNNDIGTKYNLWIYGGVYDTVIPEIRAAPWIIDSVEGANEADNFYHYFRGLTGIPAAVAQQKQLYPDIKNTLATKDIPVNSLTVIKDPSIPLVGNISSYTDRVSSHIYPQWGGIYGETTQAYIDYTLSLMAPMAPGKPHIITEAGWWTKPHPTGVTEAVQAKYTLNFLFNAFKMGVKRTYLYELVDEYPDTSLTDIEQHFGLFRYDGSAKPVATALNNLSTLLADSGALTAPGSLTYSLGGMPTNGKQLLLQRSDGVFILVLWNDERIWDNIAYKERIVAPKQVLLGLAQQAAAITVFDPLVGKNSTQYVANVSGLTLYVPDHPILVFIKPKTTTITPQPKVLGNVLASQTGKRGQAITVGFRWQAVTMNKPYRAFVHFIDATGKLIWQSDYWPSPGTDSWTGTLTNTRSITIPSGVATGSYRVVTGLFDPAVDPYISVPVGTGTGATIFGTNKHQVGVLTVTP